MIMYRIFWRLAQQYEWSRKKLEIIKDPIFSSWSLWIGQFWLGNWVNFECQRTFTFTYWHKNLEANPFYRAVVSCVSELVWPPSFLGNQGQKLWNAYFERDFCLLAHLVSKSYLLLCHLIIKIHILI